MKKKILFFIPFLKESAGGSPKLASILTMELADKYDISIITIFHFQECYPYKGKYFSLNVKRHFIGVFSNLHQLRKMIKSISPDIIISFMNLTSFWIIPMMYIFKIDVPLIIGITANPESQYRKRLYFKYLMKFLYPLKKLTVVVPVSKALKIILNKKYRINISKIIPIYIGMDIEKVKQMATEKISLYEDIFNNPDVIKFITIGRLSGEKGHKYLIEAFAKILKEVPNSMLFVIGEGRTRPNIEHMIFSKNLGKYVKLMGYMKNPFNYLLKSDIFVLPSLSEGLPYALIEALICKVPIISTNCETGPKEILEEGKFGILVEVADSDDLAEKMISLAKDEETRAHFSNISHQRIDIFDNKYFIKKWEKLIDHCLNKL
jgi:glycosyltransferase involved in cell wall biosynthesis